MVFDPLYVAAGFGVGVLVGMTGVGGGSLMTPILVLLFGMAPASAVGTDLWFAAVTKSVGGALHHAHGSVDWQVARRLWLGSIPAAIATLVWLNTTGATRWSSALLMTTLGIVLLLTAAAMVLKNRTQAIGTTLRRKTPEAFKRMQPALTVIAGVILGSLVTLTSVGAGSLCAVMLVYLYPFRMKPAKLVGTDLVHAVPLTIVAGIGHLWLGNVQLDLLGLLLLGSLPGVVVGSYFSRYAPENMVRTAIAVILVLVGIKMISL